MHTEHKERLSCVSCDKTFANLRNLQGHNRIYHKGNGMEVTCRKCGEFFEKAFTQASNRPIFDFVMSGIIVHESYLESHEKSYCVGDFGSDDDDKDKVANDGNTPKR